MNLSQKIASNTAVSAIGRVASSILALVAVSLITRSLGQEGFGEYTIVLAYLSLFVIFADLGLQSLMTREISKNEEKSRKIASNFFTLRLISSLIFLSIGVAISFMLPYSEGVRIGIILGSVGFFFLSISQILLSVFQKYLAIHLQALAEVAGRGAQLLLVYLIYVGSLTSRIKGGDLFLFIGVMSIAAGVILALNFIFARRYIPIGLSFNFDYWKNILKETWPIAFSIVLTLIYFKIDTIFLSFMKPSADVGTYGVAYRVLESLIFFPAMFSGIIMPLFSKTAVQDAAKFKKIFQKSLKAISIFAFPTVVGGWMLSYSIAHLIGGTDFVIAGAPLQALFVAVGIIFFGNILGRAVIALDLQKKAIVAYFLGMMLNIVLNFIFIPKYTYMGAAWTTVATEFFITAFLFYLIWRKTGVSVDISSTTKAAFSATMMGVVLFFLLALRILGEGGVSPLTAPASISTLLAYVALGAVVYFGVLLAVGGVSKKEVKAVF